MLRGFISSIRRVNTTTTSSFRFATRLGALGCALAIGFLAAAPAMAAKAPPAVALQQIADGFVSPLNLVSLPDGSGRMLVADQVGTVHVLAKDGAKSDKLFLDLRSKLVQVNQGFDERGLLGVALHPKFKKNRKLYIYYSAPLREGVATNWNHTSHLSEFTAAADFSTADLASERVLLKIDEPQMNHNGGRLAFGPDGLLYIGVGDGGGANDNEFGHAPQGNGQDTSVLLGKILRIDVDNGSPYGIPRDNPFADGKDGRPEIFAYGLRNPWGISFDRGGRKELFAVDVGQNLFEELNIITKGGNYGWRVWESHVPFNPANPNKALENAPTKDVLGKPFIEPVAWYKHPARGKIDTNSVEGISVTGGYVYRGKAVKGLRGKYVFGDWSRAWALPDGVLFTATPESGKRGAKWTVESLPAATTEGGKLGGYIVAFGEDAAGELYVLTNGRNSLTGQTGKVFKIVPKKK